MAVKLLWPLRKKPEAAAVALVMFAGIALLRTPLLPSMLVLTPISVLIAWKVRR
jgi:chromate transporter